VRQEEREKWSAAHAPRVSTGASGKSLSSEGEKKKTKNLVRCKEKGVKGGLRSTALGRIENERIRCFGKNNGPGSLGGSLIKGRRGARVRNSDR